MFKYISEKYINNSMEYLQTEKHQSCLGSLFPVSLCPEDVADGPYIVHLGLKFVVLNS